MKNFKTLILTAATAMTLASCGGGSAQGDPLAAIITGAVAGGAAQNQAAAATGQGVLGNLISGLMGNLTPISAASVKGVWTYDSPECRFESENLLTQAGGAMVANQVEVKLSEYLAKVGIHQGVTTFEFDGKDGCIIKSGENPVLSGTYTIDSKTRAIVIKGTTGLLTLNGTAYQTGETLTLLFNSNKLLTFMKSASTLLGSNTSTLGSLFNYDGMQMGMNLKK